MIDGVVRGKALGICFAEQVEEVWYYRGVMSCRVALGTLAASRMWADRRNNWLTAWAASRRNFVVERMMMLGLGFDWVRCGCGGGVAEGTGRGLGGADGASFFLEGKRSCYW